MTEKDLKLEIYKAINNFKDVQANEGAINLFKILGYNTERQSPFTEKTFKHFRENFLETNNTFNENKALINDWISVDLLFQITAEEVSKQNSLFDTKRVDDTIIETYLFFSIELDKKEYTRTQLAQITREVNKVFPMPALIVFKYGGNITFSVINRRLNKKDEQRDVLEKVTLIKDINIEKPHRAHIEILFDLSFTELQRVYKFTNFVELHNAWQKTLDTKELNKRFYKELSNWYFWALQEVQFPTNIWEADKNKLLSEEEKVKEHNAKNLIRLLTRLLFVWFIKEKNLIPNELFDESYIRENLLKEFKPRRRKGIDFKTQGSKYYRAILQNLFFATLNQTVGKRQFRKEGQQMNVTNLMRYEGYFKDSNLFIKLVEDIVPFMNGGLFECLDLPDPKLKGKKGGDVIIFEDGFSDRKDNTLCVPDYIFFGTSEYADLSEELGDKKQKDVEVKGLINILKSYKFTVTENTPIEEDIALDPELLGRVFENLLASYNPETKTTARKQTGSFYTPREIVDYMVDESLKVYLKQKLEAEARMAEKDAETGLEFLIGYNEREHLFDKDQINVLINAIDNCKILDPACGSGAFPMGILHKMVHILHKLDPQNKLWKERQIEKARLIDDTEIRDKLISDIETAFESNELDYGRKLYLIENCIYGLDIQPIATQISKLRFFISLIVDQKADKAKENFSIRPLPNLETKFVAANTLIGIDRPDGYLRNIELDKLEYALKDIRHRLFSAKTPTTKKKLREEDEIIRNKMSGMLENAGWSNESARQLSMWNPYNQNTTCEWFDMEWMFGITEGFNILIGNPPYISTRTKEFDIFYKKYYKDNYYLAVGQYDLFILFIEKSNKLLESKGILSFIVPKKLLTNENFQEARKFLRKYLPISKYVDAQMPFEAASVEANVIISTKTPTLKIKTYLYNGQTIDFKFEIENTLIDLMPFHIFPFAINPCNVPLINKILKKGHNKLGCYLDIVRGMECGFNHHSISNVKTNYKIIKGEHISRYAISETNWYVKPDFSNKKVFKNKAIYLKTPKILTKFVSNFIEFALDTEGLFNTNVVYNLHPKPGYEKYIIYFLALGNSKLVNFWFFNTYINDDKLFPHIQKNQLDSIPVIIPEDINVYVSIVNKICSIKNINPNSNTTILEKQIDDLIYKLYDLTDKEILIIENTFK